MEINPVGINSSEIVNVVIRFKVSNDWIADNSLNVSTVTLYRNPGTTASSWTALPTEETGNDTEYYYFSSASPGFSRYFIFARPSFYSGEPSGFFGSIKAFFERITPSFFTQTSWGYIFYYLMIAVVVLGIVAAVHGIVKRLRMSPHHIWKEGH